MTSPLKLKMTEVIIEEDNEMTITQIKEEREIVSKGKNVSAKLTKSKVPDLKKYSSQMIKTNSDQYMISSYLESLKEEND